MNNSENVVFGISYFSSGYFRLSNAKHTLAAIIETSPPVIVSPGFATKLPGMVWFSCETFCESFSEVTGMTAKSFESFADACCSVGIWVPFWNESDIGVPTVVD